MNVPFEIVQTVISAIIIGIIAYTAKKAFIDPSKDMAKIITQNAELLVRHIDECNKIPKLLLVERIDNLVDKLDDNQEFSITLREEMRKEFEAHRERIDFLSDVLNRRI